MTKILILLVKTMQCNALFNVNLMLALSCSYSNNQRWSCNVCMLSSERSNSLFLKFYP